MKLLLTSAGITNDSLAQALKDLLNDTIKIAFIPTAANTDPDGKSWLIKNLVQCDQLGEVDMVDISAISKDLWLPRLEKANVIFMGGGDTAHLLGCLQKSGFVNELPKLLESRVYVGISAGSIATNPALATKTDFFYLENPPPYVDGLGLVNFYVLPHLHAQHFPNARKEIIEKYRSALDGDIYAIDDDSGILVEDGTITVISEGDWVLFNSPR